MESIDLVAELAINDAIRNIRDRSLIAEGKNTGYNVANWKEDWLWMMDSESNFDCFCKIAGYDSDKLRDETFRLAGARIEDGIMESLEWHLADEKYISIPKYIGFKCKKCYKPFYIIQNTKENLLGNEDEINKIRFSNYDEIEQNGGYSLEIIDEKIIKNHLKLCNCL